MSAHMLSCAVMTEAKHMRSPDCNCGAYEARAVEAYTTLTRRRIAAMAFALRSRVTSPTSSPTAAALDIARNVAQALDGDEDVYRASLHAIKHRQQHYGLTCDDAEGAAEVVMGAWFELDEVEVARAKLARIAELVGDWSGGTGKLDAVKTLHAIGEVL